MKAAEEKHVKLRVPSMVVAECCQVLQSPHYQFTPRDIARVMIDFLSAEGIEADEQDTLILALQAYAEHNVDFIDAYLAVHAKHSSTNKIITFNAKDFDKLKADHLRPSAAVAAGDSF